MVVGSALKWIPGIKLEMLKIPAGWPRPSKRGTPFIAEKIMEFMGFKMTQKWMEEPWEIGPRTARYRVVGEAADELELRGLPVEFEVLSIGRNDRGQVAFVPLDESNRETAERIVACVNACRGIDNLPESFLDIEKNPTEPS